MRKINFTNAFHKCKRRVWKALNGHRGEWVEVDPETLKGREVHEVLRHYVEDPDEALVDELEELIGKSARSVIYSLEQRIKDKEVQDVEVEKYFEIPFVGEDVVNGKIDLLIKRNDGVVEIYDYKTGYNPYPSRNFNDQARIYAVSQLYEGAPQVRVFYWSVIWNVITEIKLPSAKRLLGWFNGYVNRVIKIRQLSEEPEAAPSDECNYCPFVLSCPEGKEVTITTLEEAKKALLELKKLRAKVKRIEGKVKTWINNNGNVVLDGKVYGWVDRVKTEVDFPGLYNYIVKERRDLLGEVITVSVTAAKKAAKKDPQIANFIQETVKPALSLTGTTIQDKEVER